MFPYSVEIGLADGEHRRYRDLVVAAKGNAQEKNIAPDLFQVGESEKHGGGYFITCDKLLLARTEVIASFLEIDLLMPMAFLERVSESRQRAVKFGKRLITSFNPNNKL